MPQARASRGWRSLLDVLVAAALVAACTGGDDSDDDAGAAEESTTATTIDPGVPVVGGTLRMGIGRLSSLDPVDTSPQSASSTIAADLLFDALTVVPDGGVAAEPAIASAWGSPDGARTWQFTIDPGARFSDGSAVTAGDVEFSIERLARKGPTSLAAARLDAITGYADFVAGTNPDLVGVRALDPATVEIALDRPMVSLPELLSAPSFGIVARTVVEAAAAGGEGVAPFAEAPTVGTGPFRFAERDGDTIVLTRVADGRAFLDRIELRQHDDLAASYEEFDAGRLDWSLVPPSRVDAAAESYGVAGFVPFQAELFFGFNMADPRFADIRFRRAVASAIDRDAVVNAVYFGIAQPLLTIIPEGVPGNDPLRCGEGCAYDPDRARVLVAEAFPAGGVPEVVIDYDDGADEAAVAGILEQNLETVGIPASLRPHPPDQFGSFAVSGGQVFARLGWIGVFPGPDAYIGPLFTSGSVDNVTGFGDPVVDDLLLRAGSEFDPDARIALLGQAEVEILSRAPIVGLAQFKLLSVVAEGVRGLQLTVGGMFDSTQVWLAD